MNNRNRLILQKMKTMIRNMVLLVGFVSLFGTASAQKIAHVNGDSVVYEISIRDSVDKKYMAMEKKYSVQIQQMEAEIQKLQAELERMKKDPTMPSSVLIYQEKKITDLYGAYQQFNQDARVELSQYEETLMKPIVEKVTKAIEEVAKEKGYAYVLDDKFLYYSPSGDDITSFVRKKLGL